MKDHVFVRAFNDDTLCWTMESLKNELKRSYDYIDKLQDVAEEHRLKFESLTYVNSFHESKIYALIELKRIADDTVLRYATLKSDCYEDGKAARDYLRKSAAIDVLQSFENKFNK